MRLRAPEELGALIRESRIKQGLSQHTLAERVGVSRQWILEIERGKPRAELALVLRTLNALDLSLRIEHERTAPKVNLDAIVTRARKGPRG